MRRDAVQLCGACSAMADLPSANEGRAAAPPAPEPSATSGRRAVLQRTARVHLRTIIAWITTLVVCVALVVSAALVFLTSFINHTSELLAAAVESVRIAEEIEIELLLHSRAEDPLVREDIAGDLRSKLAAAEQYVSTPAEAEVLRRAVAVVDGYLGGPPRDPALRPDAAYAAVQQLVDVNVAQSIEAQASARHWNSLADAIGITAVALLVLVAGLLLWWLRARAFRPLWDIARAMETFGTGDLDARAVEAGPAELREVARRFNQMASALAAQRRAQMTFLGGVAHDLRNPLCTLRMAVSALDRDAPPPDARTRDAMGIVARQTGQLERMVSDFLDIAKIEAGELELRMTAQDLRDLAHVVCEQFRGWSLRHPIELVGPDTPVRIRCDELRIEQAITNLLSNAIKYSPDGGPVQVVVSATGGEAVVAVRDRGVGMNPEDQRRIFEPFTRVGLSRESIPGAGLGLYIVNKIVIAHGGRVEVETAPAQGSTFRIHLPLVEPGGGDVAAELTRL